MERCEAMNCTGKLGCIGASKIREREKHEAKSLFASKAVAFSNPCGGKTAAEKGRKK